MTASAVAVLVLVVALLLTAALLLRQGIWAALQLLSRAVRRAIPIIGQSRGWAYTHPLRAWGATRFPRSYAFLRARLDPAKFTGLPLTLLAAAALYAAALFGGLIEELLFEPEDLLAVDEVASSLIGPLRTALTVKVFLWLTYLGGSPALIAAVVIATGFLWAHGRAAFLLPLWVTFLGNEATTWIGKFALSRARPSFLTEATALSPSFPSGHTTGAVAVYGFIAYTIARELPRYRDRFEIAYWTTVLIALIGFSRILLSVHFVTDVLAGLLVGGFWLLVGFTLAEWTRANQYRGGKAGLEPGGPAS